MRRWAESAEAKSEAQWWERRREFQRKVSGQGEAEKARAARSGRPEEE
jgi:hypothetical protein